MEDRRRTLSSHVLSACVMICTCPMALAQRTEVLMDGVLSDWRDADVVAVDPVGDASGSFDLSRISARMKGTMLYLRFDTQAELNLQSGSEDDGTLELLVQSPRDRELRIDFRGRQALLRADGSASTIPWSDLKFAALPTYAARDFELQVDLSGLGVQEGDRLTVQFGGSDELSAPIQLSVPARGKDTATYAGELARAEGAIRIASINTLHQGSCDEAQSKAIGELLKFSSADIFCFNEEWDEAKFKRCIGNVLPMPVFDSHWSSGCAIVTEHDLEPLPFRLQRGAAALVRLPDSRSVVVVSVHFTCCGFAGSDQDKSRIAESQMLVVELQRMRNGAFGDAAKDAGLVILGDFNLVGSRTPLDLLNRSGLDDVMLRSSIDGSAMTWRGLKPTESFWPGRLDYAVIDGQRLRVTGGYILNDEQLDVIDSRTRESLPASDHSMLVLDVVDAP